MRRGGVRVPRHSRGRSMCRQKHPATGWRPCGRSKCCFGIDAGVRAGSDRQERRIRGQAASSGPGWGMLMAEVGRSCWRKWGILIDVFQRRPRRPSSRSPVRPRTHLRPPSSHPPPSFLPRTSVKQRRLFQHSNAQKHPYSRDLFLKINHLKRGPCHFRCYNSPSPLCNTLFPRRDVAHECISQ